MRVHILSRSVVAGDGTRHLPVEVKMLRVDDPDGRFLPAPACVPGGWYPYEAWLEQTPEITDALLGLPLPAIGRRVTIRHTLRGNVTAYIHPIDDVEAAEISRIEAEREARSAAA